MNADEEKEKIKRLTQRVKETETPGRRRVASCYSRVAYAVFHEITALREEGFSMADSAQFTVLP